ncbi:PilW family protein [Deinococcus koreensis]|uniref:Uncharacterized protein n=1 Tax=Deinococcus koreensis TaxID=2054903 RepID=A0A2K3V1K9_9DEIO|nr:prepilin-type N-terminal cleavage/methylation domain-containing protein [Deinococcus koreensis]PNY82669.1 hypothetical protein CVO96_16100 [Deinococcus koreensis]
MTAGHTRSGHVGSGATLQKHDRESGVSLVELLVVMALLGVVGLAITMLLVGSGQASRRLLASAGLQQETAVVAQLVQSELRLAGYRGGDQYTGTAWTDQMRSRSLNWAVQSWPWLRGADGTTLPTVFSTLGGTPGLGLSWVEALRSDLAPAVSYSLRQTLFSMSGRTLRRTDSYFSCVVANTDIQAVAAYPCSVPSDRPTVTSPLSDHVEAFVPFYQTRSGGWSTSLPAVGEFAAIWVYLRLRSAQPVSGQTCRSWPAASLTLPAPAATLGLSRVTDSGDACTYMKTERLVTVFPASRQWWP